MIEFPWLTNFSYDKAPFVCFAIAKGMGLEVQQGSVFLTDQTTGIISQLSRDSVS
jgi:hypothetical protein